jgi:hypothetical protein
MSVFVQLHCGDSLTIFAFFGRFCDTPFQSFSQDLYSFWKECLYMNLNNLIG